MKNKVTIALTVNGKAKTLAVNKSDSLLEALRRASYTSVKYGC